MTARERLALDAAIFIAFLIAANPLVTGIGLHEWIGVTLAAPAFLHLILNWDWVTRTAAGLLCKARGVSKANLIVDIGLFVSVVGVSISGLLVIPGFAASLGLQASGIWHAIHLWTSDLTIGFSLVHLAMHANWIAETLGKLSQPSAVTANLAAQPGRVHARDASARREAPERS